MDLLKTRVRLVQSNGLSGVSIRGVDSCLRYSDSNGSFSDNVPPAPAKPELSSEGWSLKVAWILPELSSNTVTMSAVRVKAVDESNWSMVDTSQGKNSLVDSQTIGVGKGIES